MNIEKKPFVSYTLEEDKKDPLESGKVLTCRLNPQEYKNILYFGKLLNISRDSTILKQLAIIGQNVLLNTFGADFLKWLSDSKRIIDDSKLDKIIIKKEENVTQN